MSDKRLTPKEALFIEHLLRGRSQRRAAILAGFAEPSAAKSADNLLRRPHVVDALEARLQRERVQTQIDRETLRKTLMAIATFSLPSLFEPGSGFMKLRADIPAAAKAALVSIRSWDSPESGSGASARAADKLGAMKLLLRHYLAEPQKPWEDRGQELAEEVAQIAAAEAHNLFTVEPEDEPAPPEVEPEEKPPAPEVEPPAPRIVLKRRA